MTPRMPSSLACKPVSVHHSAVDHPAGRAGGLTFKVMTSDSALGPVAGICSVTKVSPVSEEALPAVLTKSLPLPDKALTTALTTATSCSQHSWYRVKSCSKPIWNTASASAAAAAMRSKSLSSVPVLRDNAVTMCPSATRAVATREPMKPVPPALVLA